MTSGTSKALLQRSITGVNGAAEWGLGRESRRGRRPDGGRKEKGGERAGVRVRGQNVCVVTKTQRGRNRREAWVDWLLAGATLT